MVALGCLFPMIKTFWFNDHKSWLDSLETDFLKVIGSALEQRGKVHVALSGGGTPRPFYVRLNRSSLPWSRIDWWLGDERWVPPTDVQSNERMIRENLGEGHPEFALHFHSWHLSENPDEAAKLYEMRLKEIMGATPAFDLVLLGLGSDGHTASLFPWSSALEETRALAVKNEVMVQKSTRLTFTYPLLNRSREIWFLVDGKEKSEQITRLLHQDETIPAGRIKAQNQKLYWNQ